MEGKITIISTETVTNIKTKFTTRTITTTISVFISLHIINHIALCIIKKATNYGITPKKNKKSLKLSLGLPTEISLINLTTDLTNDSINIL